MQPPANHFCPFLGLRDDPDSSAAFPSYSNYCHHSQPIGSVQYEHQAEFCLTQKHRECPVFLRRETIPLPGYISGQKEQRAEFSSALVRNSLLVAVSLLILALVIGKGFINREQPSAEQVNPTIQAIAPPTKTVLFSYLLDEPTATPSSIPTITQTPTLHVPLFGSVTPTKPATITPSVTFVALVSKHQLNIPIGTDRKFIIRRVEFGDYLDSYIQQYSTSFKAVSAINYDVRITDRARGDMLVVFPIGFVNVSGMHALSIYQIKETERGINFEYLAKKFKVDEESIKYYNGIGELGERPLVGDYYLIPRQVIP